MDYGCIGEKLSHSFSKEIHNLIADYDYDLKELPLCEVGDFISSGDYLGINVTIPYKETVIPYLDEIDTSARLIGSVNTIVKKDGRLFGYNTDFYGMIALISHARICVKDKKVLILGTGGTSKTAASVCRELGAKCIIKASRSADKGGVLYTDVYNYHTNAEIIINTTPVGMYPNISNKPIDISKFPKLIGVIDAIYNPLSTSLILDAKARGIKAEGGLYMLAAQAVKASEYFGKVKSSEAITERIYKALLKRKNNIVLIGMPSAGKTTVGALISKMLCRKFIDTDEVIKRRFGDITSIFKERGESEFRRLESDVVNEISAISSVIIATGGGAVLNESNVLSLRKNSRIYFIDRPLNMLISTEDRPLATNNEDIEKLYNARIELYRKYADRIIDGAPSPEDIAKEIISDFEEYYS